VNVSSKTGPSVTGVAVTERMKTIRRAGIGACTAKVMVRVARGAIDTSTGAR
jgi:hypothetical protein